MSGFTSKNSKNTSLRNFLEEEGIKISDPKSYIPNNSQRSQRPKDAIATKFGIAEEFVNENVPDLEQFEAAQDTLPKIFRNNPAQRYLPADDGFPREQIIPDQSRKNSSCSTNSNLARVNSSVFSGSENPKNTVSALKLRGFGG